MNELRITIDCPDIIRAAEIIAEAIRGGATHMDKKPPRHRVVFSKNDITAMNAMILGGKGIDEIAKTFGCHPSTVYRRRELLSREVGV